MKEISEIFNSIFPISGESLNKVLDITEYKNYNKGDSFIEKDKREYNEYFLIRMVP